MEEETLELMMFFPGDTAHKSDNFVVWNIKDYGFIAVFIKRKGITLNFQYAVWRDLSQDILAPDEDDAGIYAGICCSYWTAREDGQELTGLYIWENKCLIRFTPQEWGEFKQILEIIAP